MREDFVYGFILGLAVAVAAMSFVACFLPSISHGGVVVVQPQAVTAPGQQAAAPTGGGTVKLVGSGSTFVKPAMDRWINEFHRLHPRVYIEYMGGGSGKGVSDLLAGLVDFAGSDPPLPRDKWEELRGRVLQFPVVLGAVVVSYNLPGLRGVALNLTGDVIAGIYLGEISYWDDPAIKKLNPAVADKLPHHEITVIHRSDASGTTELFTLFLYKSSQEWRKRIGYGKTVEWPVDETGRGIGQEGNQGVTQALLSTPYSIGYIEWSYALDYNLPVARIANPYGVFVAPSVESIAAAYRISSPPSPFDDWSSVAKSFIYSNASRDAYPIVGQTFMLVRTGLSSSKCRAMKSFIEYIAGPGQDNIPRGYAPLPETLRETARRAAAALCGGENP